VAPVGSFALRQFEFLLYCLLIVAAALGLFLIVGITWDILGRGFGWGINGIVELSEYALYLMCLLAIPHCVLSNQHIRLDVVLVAVPKPLRRIMEIGGSFFCAFLCFLIAGIAWYTMSESMRSGGMIYKTYWFPEWWLYAPFAPTMVLAGAAFLIVGARAVAYNLPAETLSGT